MEKTFYSVLISSGKESASRVTFNEGGLTKEEVRKNIEKEIEDFNGNLGKYKEFEDRKMKIHIEEAK